MAVRNLEQQVEYLTKELTKLKQQLGGALPDPIAGPQGDPGPQGDTGPEGPIGYGISGCTAALPSPTAYRDGDFYLLFNGNLYKKINGSWVLQTSLRGPQGVVGPAGGTEVIANPVDAATDELNKVKIDGTTYNIKDFSTSQVNDLKNILHGEFGYDTVNNKYVFGDDVVDFNYPVTYYGNIVLKYGLHQIADENGDALVICENFNDANGNARFVEGDLTTGTVSGVTFTYAKWSLSGTHLMIVLCGEIANGATIGVVNLASAELPEYIRNKIVAVFATNYIAIHDDRAYYDDWNSVSLQNALYKTDDGLGILQIANPTTTNVAHFRIQYDLIIDLA